MVRRRSEILTHRPIRRARNREMTATRSDHRQPARGGWLGSSACEGKLVRATVAGPTDTSRAVRCSLRSRALASGPKAAHRALDGALRRFGARSIHPRSRRRFFPVTSGAGSLNHTHPYSPGIGVLNSCLTSLMTRDLSRSKRFRSRATWRTRAGPAHAPSPDKISAISAHESLRSIRSTSSVRSSGSSAARTWSRRVRDSVLRWSAVLLRTRSASLDTSAARESGTTQAFALAIAWTRVCTTLRAMTYIHVRHEHRHSNDGRPRHRRSHTSENASSASLRTERIVTMYPRTSAPYRSMASFAASWYWPASAYDRSRASIAVRSDNGWGDSILEYYCLERNMHP